MGASCWKRFCWELRPSYPFFSLEEASTVKPVEGTIIRRHIDVAGSFAPHRGAILIRLFFLAWSLQVLYTDVTAYPPHNLYIYMGYLTHWNHALSNCYFFCSCLCAMIPSATQQPVNGEDIPGRLVRTTWGLYSCVAPLGIAVTILYWSGTAFISGHGSYVAVMEHGGIASMVLIDGLLVGLIPVRAKHVVYLLTLSICYMTWSIVDAVLDIGNGEWGPAEEDDALYPVLNWNNDQNGATIVSAFVICILSPCLFYLCWALSLKSSPRSCSDGINTLHHDDEAISTTTATTRHGCCSGNFDGSRRPLYPLVDSSAVTELSDPRHYKVMEDMVIV